jgi:site-specific recombinase, phage integrase family
LRYLKNTLKKYRKNEAERPTNQKCQACRKPFKLNDGKGLYLYINTSGGKLWRFDFSHNGKCKTLSIGKYPTVSLVEARQAAENARCLLASG